MIPFASQRANGQDLATHLLNEHDNDYMRVLSIEGCVADDLHGAFAEWELQGQTLTNAKNYIYALSANPKEELSEEQMLDYIDRVEQAVGLVGQPRIIVEHIKNDRMHWHAAWSRIDVENEKAIPISYDRQKLMMMTREYARDHRIELPQGYYKKFEKTNEKDKDYNLGEKYQFESTGLTKEERSRLVTELWRARDTPETFLTSLEHHGYILTQGRRPYMLVDLYGHMNSLPKLIADSDVRTKQIRDFLGKDRELPDLEGARTAASELLEQLQIHKQSESQAERIGMLKRNQAERRKELDNKLKTLLAEQKEQRSVFDRGQYNERQQLREEFQVKQQKIRQEREEKKITGLAAFLAKVSGVELVQKKLQRHQDMQRVQEYQGQKQVLLEQQGEQVELLRHKQQMKSLDMVRQQRALEQRDKRELQSLQKSFELEGAKEIRGGYQHMSGVELKLSPRGRPTMVFRAKQRFTSDFAKEKYQQHQQEANKPSEVNAGKDFERVSDQGKAEQMQQRYQSEPEKKSSSYSRPKISKPSGKNKGRER